MDEKYIKEYETERQAIQGLINKYPNLFLDARADFHVGIGWIDILDRLFAKIYKYAGEEMYVLQIKEKFGGLRVYLSGSEPEVEEAIREAEDEAYKTCEYCGKPGKPGGVGWIKTMCDECRG